jgi:hypothetical protein
VAFVTLVAGMWSLLAWVLFFRQPSNLIVTDEGYVSDPVRVNVWWLLASLLSLALGVVLFVVPLPNSAGHSTWHLLAAFALIAWSEALTPSNWPTGKRMRIAVGMETDEEASEEGRVRVPSFVSQHDTAARQAAAALAWPPSAESVQAWGLRLRQQLGRQEGNADDEDDEDDRSL